jgi:hypothetical protein
VKRPSSLSSILFAVVVLGLQSRCALAAPRNRKLPAINLTYRGGRLVQNVRVATLFWGSNWSGSQLPGYFNGFFQALFANGRFMANLAQYGTGSYPIGNGSFAASVIDNQQPPSRLQDSQIQAEIRAQIAAGHLPGPDANTAYVVFTPPHVEVFDRYGDNSFDDFYSYHDYVFGSNGFPYIVVAYDDGLNDPRFMTVYASHELPEVVTDPEVTGADNQVGWYDDYYGEVTDIVDTLYDAGVIGDAELLDELDAPDGSVYPVEKFWSVRDNAPVAF